MKQKLSKVKFFNAIEVNTNSGKTHLSYFDEKRDDNYEMILLDSLIKITHKVSGDVVYSSLSNVIYFGLKDE